MPTKLPINYHKGACAENARGQNRSAAASFQAWPLRTINGLITTISYLKLQQNQLWKKVEYCANA